MEIFIFCLNILMVPFCVYFAVDYWNQSNKCVFGWRVHLWSALCGIMAAFAVRNAIQVSNTLIGWLS